MSQHNMALGAFDRGRAGSAQYIRRQATAFERMQVRSWIRRGDYEGAIPQRQKVYRKEGQLDHINPLDRYMQKQVGRSWNEVYSELCQRFDKRSLAGHHLVWEHARYYVLDRALTPWFLWGYFIDTRGILRFKPKERIRREPRVVKISEEVRNWLAGRRVRKMGTVFFWLDAVYGLPISGIVSWKQGVPFSRKDLVYWQTLSEGVRTALLSEVGNDS